MAKRTKSDSQPESLKGWKEIAAFLSQPIAVAQRWWRSGMPVEKKGRYVYSSPEALNRWLGRESAGEPVQITTEKTDLGTELRRGLSFVQRSGSKKKAA